MSSLAWLGCEAKLNFYLYCCKMETYNPLIITPHTTHIVQIVA